MVACSGYAGYISPKDMRGVETFRASVGLYAVGAVAELLYEPLLVRAVRLGQPSLRVKAEGLAVFTKVLSTIATIVLFPRWTSAPTFISKIVGDEKAVALLAFGIGQASFGLTMLFVHLWHFVSLFSLHSTLDLYIPKKDGEVWLDRPTLSLCSAMAQQGVLKHALTEADKFAVARYATLEDQGGYALASAYGSLVARIVFQPIEETARIVFSSELIPLDPTSPASTSSVMSKGTLERVSGMLQALFRLHTLLACLLVTFGGPLAKPFLYIMAGPQWALRTSAPEILAAYTFYLPIMGINGIVEGFVQSVASKRQVSRYSRVLLLASASFVGVLVGANKVSAGDEAKTGLVWANALSLLVRAGWCWSFLINYFNRASKEKEKGTVEGVRPTNALPRTPTLVIFAAVALGLRMAVPKVMPTNAQLLVGSGMVKGAAPMRGRLQAMQLLVPTLGLAMGCLAVVVGSIALFERKALVRSLRALGRGRVAEKDAKKTQ